ncbi:hypothetical protein V6N13_008788 [Hibiscus sabdariffa]
MALCNQNSSRLWKGLSVVWSDIRQNLHRSLGNGSLLIFLFISWVSDIGPLVKQLLPSVDSNVSSVMVVSMADSNGHWIWPFFQHMLPHHVLLCIVVIKTPITLLGTNIVGWSRGVLNRFSVKAVYDVCSSTSPIVVDNVWGVIHKHQGLQHIRIFLWLVCLNKIMKNMERGRRHLTTYIICPVCRDAPEDVDHVLHSCASKVALWCSLIKSGKVT